MVGTIDPASGAVRSLPLGERIGNSFAVDETGGVYIVTDAALYRLRRRRERRARRGLARGYENTGVAEAGPGQAGSGTTPTLMGDDLVAITDNADPMNVVVYRRGARDGPRRSARSPCSRRARARPTSR